MSRFSPYRSESMDKVPIIRTVLRAKGKLTFDEYDAPHDRPHPAENKDGRAKLQARGEEANAERP